jgi:glycosyltransferase involved in cell wall biosynthesis
MQPCKGSVAPRQRSSVQATISAIITAYNSADYICDAMESVRRQTVRPSEIIVVDDGSTDSTPERVAGFNGDIRYFYQQNSGEGAARNQGIALARGDLIAFLDADDCWPPARLATLSACLTANGSIIACGRARAFANEPWTQALSAGPNRPEAFLMSFGCALIHRDIFDVIGDVDVTMRNCVDLDWFFRCRERKVPIKVIDDVVLLYRRHHHNVSLDVAAGREGLMRTVKQSLDRRRRGKMTTETLAPWESLGRDE